MSYFLKFKKENQAKHTEKIQEILRNSPLRPGNKDSSIHLTQSSFSEIKPKLMNSKDLNELLGLLGLDNEKPKIVKKTSDKLNIRIKKDSHDSSVDYSKRKKNKTSSFRSSLSPLRWQKERKTEKSPFLEKEQKSYSISIRNKRKINY